MMWHRRKVYPEGKWFLKIDLPDYVCFPLVLWSFMFMNTYDSFSRHEFKNIY